MICENCANCCNCECVPYDVECDKNFISKEKKEGQLKMVKVLAVINNSCCWTIMSKAELEKLEQSGKVGVLATMEL
jgi:hypothetical protein